MGAVSGVIHLAIFLGMSGHSIVRSGRTYTSSRLLGPITRDLGLDRYFDIVNILSTLSGMPELGFRAAAISKVLTSVSEAYLMSFLAFRSRESRAASSSWTSAERLSHSASAPSLGRISIVFSDLSVKVLLKGHLERTRLGRMVQRVDVSH